MEPLAANAETGVLWVHKKSGNWIIKSVTGSAEKHRKPDHPLKIVLPVWSAAVFNPVVQMTAFKQPVYCAQFPAAFQD